jgi:hypothetical protein
MRHNQRRPAPACIFHGLLFKASPTSAYTHKRSRRAYPTVC